MQPETLLRGPRELFRLFWTHKSKAHARKPKLSPKTIALIKEMAANNRLWGAERIRGELLKLNIRVSKRTIQKYMKHVQRNDREDRPGKRSCAIMRQRCGLAISCRSLISSFVHFLPFSTSSLKSRKVLHVNVTRSPTDPWVARTAPRSDAVWPNTQVPHPG
jgi:putative transposase